MSSSGCCRRSTRAFTRACSASSDSPSSSTRWRARTSRRSGGSPSACSVRHVAVALDHAHRDDGVACLGVGGARPTRPPRAATRPFVGGGLRTPVEPRSLAPPRVPPPLHPNGAPSRRRTSSAPSAAGRTATVGATSRRVARRCARSSPIRRSLCALAPPSRCARNRRGPRSRRAATFCRSSATLGAKSRARSRRSTPTCTRSPPTCAPAT